PPAPTHWWPHIRRAAARNLHLFGIFTHLHSADESDLTSARRQIQRFDDFVRAADGIDPGTLLHCANSAGTLRLASQTANAVRPGIYLYGGSAGPGTEPPETAVHVRARVVLARDVPGGATVGYGATYRSKGPERWAAAGIGYGDGLPRTLANRGWGLAGGRRVPLLGRISMDTTVVRVGGDTSPGDVVTFLGRDGENELTLEEVAELADTIEHEILTGLSRRLPRMRIET
ncbi:MAG: alanine racemase, partial [Gemmatimonadetes bacterium]|nr:alanine racemase [Gemmatimonadota bacterium]